MITKKSLVYQQIHVLNTSYKPENFFLHCFSIKQIFFHILVLNPCCKYLLTLSLTFGADCTRKAPLNKLSYGHFSLVLFLPLQSQLSCVRFQLSPERKVYCRRTSTRTKPKIRRFSGYNLPLSNSKIGRLVNSPIS